MRAASLYLALLVLATVPAQAQSAPGSSVAVTFGQARFSDGVKTATFLQLTRTKPFHPRFAFFIQGGLAWRTHALHQLEVPESGFVERGRKHVLGDTGLRLVLFKSSGSQARHQGWADVGASARYRFEEEIAHRSRYRFLLDFGDLPPDEIRSRYVQRVEWGALAAMGYTLVLGRFETGLRLGYHHYWDPRDPAQLFHFGLSLGYRQP